MRGKHLYYIAVGRYPVLTGIADYGRFFSWGSASEFMISKGLSFETHTIMCENGCPF